MIYSASNEQGFSMKMHGEPQRQVVEMEGIQLIKSGLRERFGVYWNSEENRRCQQMTETSGFSFIKQ